jgi:5S rRNA maturation endonuclease (ribonuclease M5)
MTLREAFDEAQDSLIIVEGSADRKALQLLGCRRILMLEKKAIFEVVEAVKDKEVIILTDFDREGKKLYHRLYQKFSQRGVRVNNTLRHLLLNAKVSHIETLNEEKIEILDEGAQPVAKH